ncbi:MAG: DNA polymerase III subunit gamma/tau [Clostridia bacterium]|nr:DNA polymerase III subunit gamma/tau [Clostridia bacterium]
MAYQALYRKWRPMKFDDVIGQQHITQTIRNEINCGTVAHAYLFTGTRGTGKTTTAKILSRAVNCASPIDGNPCNECEVCKSILGEVCLDVQEIDAASNTGVDNIRDIISQVSYVPTMGKYKVFIIDEVHMLSKGAFNALLKTLEEPPAHVIFILATTEIQQIPATILSRCQRFDFKTISISDIVSNIKSILFSEGITATDDALEYVAYLGDGSMRDSLSILDQCLAFSDGELTLDKVTNVVGAVDDKTLYDFAGDVALGDTVSALRRFNDCVSSGKNFDNIAKGLLSVFREIIMYKINRENFSASKIKKQYLESCADKFDVPFLVNCINILTDCIVSFKTFSSHRVLCECALIRLTTPSMNDDYDSLNARISSLEAKLCAVSQGGFSAPVLDETAPCIDKISPAPTDDIPLPEPPLQDDEPAFDASQAKHSAASQAAAKWNDITSALASNGKITLCALLYGVDVKAADNTLYLCVSNPDNRHALSEKTNLDAINAAIASVVGSDVNVRISSDDIHSSVSGDDLFQSLGAMGKDFPSNFNLD